MPKTKIFNTQYKNLKKIVNYLLSNCQKNSIYLLFGELGSGKTALVKLFAKNIGIKLNVSSPTFLIAKNYNINNKNKLYHFDLYRINSYNELIEIGFEEILTQNNIIFIEWPNKIKNLKKYIEKKCKKNIVKIFIYHTNKKDVRKIIIKK